MDRNNSQWKSNKRAGNNTQKVPNLLLTGAFGVVLVFFLMLNCGAFRSVLSEAWRDRVLTQEELAQAEGDFQSRVNHRNYFIDLYGAALTVTNERVVGNFDFVKDSHGIIQRFCSEIRYDKFLNCMKELRKLTETKEIPLVYLALPAKTRYLSLADSCEFVFDGQQSKKAGDLLQQQGFDCIDFDTIVGVDSDAPSFDDFFFKTDVHCTTYAEFWMAKTTTEYLMSKYGIVFPDEDMVFNLENYTTDSYEFLGNTARSAGRFFTKLDQFEIYKPKYRTNISLNNPSMSEHRSGTFEQVILNGYENQSNTSEYTYWVTDFGHFESPYYEYINHDAAENAPDILVLCDSVFMRGFSYLSLACRKLTVFDNRFFEGTEYLSNSLATEHYDAIIVVGTSNTFFVKSFRSAMELPTLEIREMISPEEYGEWIGNRGVCIETCNDNSLKGSTVIPIELKETDISLRGWACDFINKQPYQKLYIIVGDIVLDCNYGLERKSVSEHFNNGDLLSVGFQFCFPTSYLKSGEVTEISFYGVSADGQYLYGPAVYTLDY